MLENLNILGLFEYEELLRNLVKDSAKRYHEVYEHGDFAAWNLIQTKEGLIPLDFEYFVEKGLQYLDEIKFHFQEQHLLHNKKGLMLVKAIASKLHIEEFHTIFKIFLVKEILNKAQEKEPFDHESALLALAP